MFLCDLDPVFYDAELQAEIANLAVLLRLFLPRKQTCGDHQWTGAEIKICSANAAEMKIPFKKAATYIVPVAVSAGEQMRALRMQASGKYIDAAEPRLSKFEERETGTATHARAMKVE